ncbi:MAG: hypothetical protein MH825_04750 [Cyanobacteria bacterium]|nr:hypothetical protein [Cyanobacteriota bacterium]
MTNPQQIAQWIDEIQTLKQQVTDLKRDRDAAYEAAERWQERYTIEAQQRRREAEAARLDLQRLQQQLDRFQGIGDGPMAGETPQDHLDMPTLGGDEPDADGDLLQECRDLRQRIRQLAQALQAEQQAHETTRQNLTTALGDAIEALGRERSRPT